MTNPNMQPFLRELKRFGKTLFLLSFLLVVCQRGLAQETREITLEKTLTTKLKYQCFVTTPKGYEDDTARDWPMILFLHGGGSPKPEELKNSMGWLTDLPAIVVVPICPPSEEGWQFQNWNWKMLGELVREIDKQYQVDPKMRSVIGFSMGGSGAWELPFHEPKLFSKSVVIAGLCHPWSLRHFPKIPVWDFVGEKDYMRKEQEETVSSARRFGVDVVQTTWKGADHGGIFKNAKSYQRMLDWLVTNEDLRREEVLE